MKKPYPPSASPADVAPELHLLAEHREEHKSPLALTSFTSSPGRSDRDSQHDRTANSGPGEAAPTATFGFDQDALAALREFFELLDNWDRKGNHGQSLARKSQARLSVSECKPIAEQLQIAPLRAEGAHSRDVGETRKTIG